MTLVLTFFLNAALNFATGLAVATVLGPEEFGQFAVASMIAIVLSTSLFDWLRLSATRHYNDHARESRPELRSSLDSAYLAGAFVLTVGALSLIALNFTPWLPAGLGLPAILVIAIAAASFANGQFDYWSALARARFLDKTYIQLVLYKNALALALMVIAGNLFHSTAWVLAALIISIVIAIACVWERLRDTNTRLAFAKRDQILTFAKYGVPIVVANVFYQIIALVNRWVIADKLGYAEAGQLSLATDITIRVFLSLGAGFDVFLFQKAVRLETTHGLAAAQTQIAKNIVLVCAALVPFACGYAVIMPFFEALFVPSAYHGYFGKISLILIPGVLSFCLSQFAFGPILQMAHRTGPLVWAGAIGMMCDLVLLGLLPPGFDVTAFAAVHSLSLFVSSLIVALFAFRTCQCIPPLRDVISVLISAAIMVLAIWPLRTISWPWLAMLGSVVIGVSVYAFSLFALNVADLRHTFNVQFRSLGRLTK
jgi:O-antigen/teichoic acid export membrane protein